MPNHDPLSPLIQTEHLLSLDELCQQLGTSANGQTPTDSQGLSSDKAAQLLAQNGPNLLAPPKKKHPILIYIAHLTSLFNLLLIFAGCLVYTMYFLDPRENANNVFLGGILIGVAFANAFIEFYQGQKTASVLGSFLSMIPAQCYAIRDGSLNQVPAADLVVGDVVLIRMGDKIPADVYLFSATDMKVDNSSLTGESEPQERRAKNDHHNPLEACNVAFNGTLTISGEGYGVVIRTGERTMLGQIANMTSTEKKGKSPLSREIDNFVKIIAAIATVTAIVFFVIGYLTSGGNLNRTLTFAIGVFVAWVPEGLPATVTVSTMHGAVNADPRASLFILISSYPSFISYSFLSPSQMLLTIAAKRMATQSVLVKDLEGVETLGAITLLATDKTGTLTRNQMTVTNIWSSQTMYSALRNMGVEGNPIQGGEPGIQEIMHISGLCTRAQFERTDIPMGERTIVGDATESGLFRFASSNLPEFDHLSHTYPKVFEVPFNSTTKTHTSIHQKSHSEGPFTLFLKGAPERVLRVCSTILINGQAVPLTEEHTRDFYGMYEHMAGKGHRVLAFAQLLLPESQYPSDYVFDKDAGNYPKEGLTFVGLVSLEDPPKHGVREAVGRCRTAGIKVMMVTGDHPLTAEAIGRKINMMTSETKAMVAKRRCIPEDQVDESECDAIVIHGETIDGMTDTDWDIVFSKAEIIFARTSPKHKLEIVKRAQSIGHIVGVTGDGVNDSPALKKADLGIAMNLSGSDVSKDAASMILLDDNFASTVRGIEEGRLIFANLKKSIQYTISHSMPEVVPNLLYVILPIPMPISAILILVIDLGFELIAALTYAWEVPESENGLMHLPPRKPVTPASIVRVREKAARALKGPWDPETGDYLPPSRGQRFEQWVSEKLSPSRWFSRSGPKEGEELVDGKLLSWAYLEAGMIEALGCLTTYFAVLWSHGITPTVAQEMASYKDINGIPLFREDSSAYAVNHIDLLTGPQQVTALAQAQSAFFLGLMIQQLCNLFACKAKLKTPFGLHIFKNAKTFIGAGAGAILSLCVVYIPPLNVAFGTDWRLNPIFLLIPFGFGLFIIVYAGLRITLINRSNPIKWNEDVSGLMMHPTVHTVMNQKC